MNSIDPQSAVLDRYVRRGFAYEQAVLGFRRHFARHHAIQIAESADGIWVAKREGVRLGTWDTLHEMVIALMAQLQGERA